MEKAMVSDNGRKATRKRLLRGSACIASRRLWKATFCLNEVALPGDSEHRFVVVPEPTPLQKKAFELLGVDLGKFVPSKLTG